jgi:anti-sigma factor RsiW
MSTEFQHEEIEGLLGAYALDAIDADEALAIEAHLAECPRCRAEVDVHFEMAGAIGNTVESPPAGLWDRIADRLAAPAGLDESPPMPNLGSGHAATASGPSAGESAKVVELADARANQAARSSKAVMRVSAVVAAAAVVVISILAVNLSRVDNRVGQIQSAFGGQSSQAVISQALANPEHRLANLKGATGEKLAEFVVTPDGRGYLVSSSMPSLPASQTYQLWAFIGGKPISLGLLGNRPKQAGFTVAGSAVPTSLAVTIEPAGGVASPDRAPVAAGRIVVA